jgi:alkylhydroperoxidase/carboxymuconolactone decarboxylase family protein YurZ
VEVFQVISILGVHSMMLSIPILLEEAEARGLAVGDGELTMHQTAIKQSYVDSRGYWPPSWDSILAVAPDFVQAHERLGAVPFEQGVLEPKVREFILIAVDASTTHLFPTGVRTHTRAALEHGASVAEIVEVLALTCAVGTQSVTFGVPILLEEVARFTQAAEAANGGTDARS